MLIGWFSFVYFDLAFLFLGVERSWNIGSIYEDAGKVKWVAIFVESLDIGPIENA